MGTYATPVPGVPIYGQAAALATQAYQNTLARLNQQRMRTLQSNGYTGSIDPQTGVLSGMHVDPFNQYGNLQTMLRSQAQEDTGAHYAAEQRGVTGGLAHQGVSELRYQHGSQSAQLGTSLADTLSGYQDQQTQAAYDRDMALWQAEQAAAQQAIANGDFNPAQSGSGDSGGGSGTDWSQVPVQPTGGGGGHGTPAHTGGIAQGPSTLNSLEAAYAAAHPKPKNAAQIKLLNHLAATRLGTGRRYA